VIAGKAACLAVVTAAAVFGVQGTPLSRHISRSLTNVQNAVADAIIGPQFGDVAMSMERYHDLAGTYDGADLSGRGIVVRWATDAHYCVDGVSESGTVEHLLGPYARVEPGSCPVVEF
jgi:hypothetical protein